MTEQLPMMLAFLMAGLAGLTAIYFWRQKVSLAQDQKSLAADNLRLKEQQSLLDRSLNELKEKLQGTQKSQAKLEKELEASLARLERLKNEEKSKALEAEQGLSKALDQLEHFQAQTKALTEQLLEVDNDKREFRLKWEMKLEEAEEKHKQDRHHWEKSLSDLKRQLKNMDVQRRKAEAQLQQSSAKLEAVDPMALKKAKSRINQYHHLYQIMRGHKEMAEERNRNWELALGILAAWIIKEHAPSKTLPENLGSLVAKALETIKHGPLIDDDAELIAQEGEALAAFNKARSTAHEQGRKLKELTLAPTTETGQPLPIT